MAANFLCDIGKGGTKQKGKNPPLTHSSLWSAFERMTMGAFTIKEKERERERGRGIGGFLSWREGGGGGGGIYMLRRTGKREREGEIESR